MSRKAALQHVTKQGRGPSGATVTRRLTLDEAQEQIRRCLFPVAARKLIPAADGVNRILASDLAAPLDMPPQNRAALDGYAFRSADLPAVASAHLHVIGRSVAGHPFAGKIGPGEAIRILTGGSVPTDADTVILQEACQEQHGVVSFPVAEAAKNHIRRRGEDFRIGDTVLRQGHRLQPVDLGMVAACGMPILPVYESLRVALFSTGDELVEPGLTLQPGQMWDANRTMLRALISETGATVTDLGILPDNEADMLEAMTGAAHEHDLIVTSGGMSVGDEDHVKQVIRRRGRLELWRLAIKPGKPVGFGDIDDCPIIGLPGNPVAAIVTFLLLGRPALLRLSGCLEAPNRSLRLPLAAALTKEAGRREFLLGKTVTSDDGMTAVEPVSKRGSAMLSALLEADGLIDLDEAATEIAAGQPVAYLPLRRPR
ncbi:MAG TPA: gephyrin-like molybdotransferase Glp [Terriglobales bacterium]|nr:gephyrin-like molybdotransferase Glp [Terriglobales bacterium]